MLRLAIRRTGHLTRNRAELGVAGALLAALPLLAACVSRDYQTAPKKTPPAVAINLPGHQPPLVAVLRTVIYFEGPGSWKREAYWDEYVVSIVNQSATPIDVGNVALASSVIAAQSPGTDPWAIEKQSHKILSDQALSGKISAGAGVSLEWVAAQVAAETTTAALATAALTTGSTVAVAGTVAAALALPVIAIGTGVRAFTAPRGIEKEFKLRRLALPLQLKPGEMLQGSLFFPITPGPQRLEISFGSGAATQTAAIDLAPLSGLHLQNNPGAATPPAAR